MNVLIFVSPPDAFLVSIRLLDGSEMFILKFSVNSHCITDFSSYRHDHTLHS